MGGGGLVPVLGGVLGTLIKGRKKGRHQCDYRGGQAQGPHLAPLHTLSLRTGGMSQAFCILVI